MIEDTGEFVTVVSRSLARHRERLLTDSEYEGAVMEFHDRSCKAGAEDFPVCTCTPLEIDLDRENMPTVQQVVDRCKAHGLDVSDG